MLHKGSGFKINGSGLRFRVSPNMQHKQLQNSEGLGFRALGFRVL